MGERYTASVLVYTLTYKNIAVQDKVRFCATLLAMPRSLGVANRLAGSLRPVYQLVAAWNQSSRFQPCYLSPYTPDC